MQKRPIWAVLLIIMMASCSKQATGQTVAVVNDEEISLSELNAEVARARVPANADKKAVMSQILQQIIDRKLLAQAAVKDGIDRSREFLTEDRRMHDELLMGLFAKRQMDTIKLATKAEIDKFMTGHPNMFEHRTVLTLDQLLFDPPKDPSVAGEFKDDHSLDEIAATLTKHGMQYTKAQPTLDLGTVSPSVADQINNLPAGEPFIVPSGGKLTASVITGRKEVTASPEAMRSLAAAAIRQQKFAELMQSRLKEARGAAKIEYQPEYQPKPPTKATPPAGKSAQK